MPTMSRTALKTAPELLVQYARYHRDPRNIATHFVGIPMIVFAIGVLLARPVMGGADGWMMLTPAWLLWVVATLWYLTRKATALALAVSLCNGALVALAQPVGAWSTTAWLTTGLVAFFLGWVIQFLGHYYEGRKPAFMDDLRGLLVGPQFIVAEALFAMGLLTRLKQRIEQEAGPTHLRDLTAPAA
jgi:uncharacterized membrane protein YGL010W